MNQNSRTQNVVRNIIGGVGGQIFTSVLQFVCRTIFIRLLGATYLGVNGLFSNILSMLSLAELGIGPAIVFSMYKPIANNDEVQIAKLMHFYKLAYRAVAGAVLMIGLCLTPFLDFFIKDTQGIENLRLIFLLILSNTVVSYLFAYKGSILNADQKAYAVVIIRNIFSVVQNAAQILVLMITKNFLLYLVVQIITTFLGNLALSKYVDKKYPFLTQHPKEKLKKEETKDIFRRVRGMMIHKLGGFVLNSTDNLVISKFVGVVSVGLYSNYLTIINMIKGYLTQITGSLSASVGNLIAKESTDKSYSVFRSLFLVFFWIYGFCFVCFWVVFQPFITLWAGAEYLLPGSVLFLVLLNIYFTGIQNCSNTFVNATGLFWETRHKPIFECIINLSVSIVLAWKIGLSGVFIGTIASYLCTFWVNPVLLYRKVFCRPVSSYFVRFSLYALTAVGTALALDYVAGLLPITSPLLQVIARLGIAGIGSNLIFFLIWGHSKDFLWIKNIAKGVFIKRKVEK